MRAPSGLNTWRDSLVGPPIVKTSWPVRASYTAPSPPGVWTLRFELANGQVIRYAFGAIASQSRAANGRDVILRGLRLARRVRPSPTPSPSSVQASFIATDDGTANAAPPNFRLNQRRCATV